MKQLAESHSQVHLSPDTRPENTYFHAIDSRYANMRTVLPYVFLLSLLDHRHVTLATAAAIALSRKLLLSLKLDATASAVVCRELSPTRQNDTHHIPVNHRWIFIGSVDVVVGTWFTHAVTFHAYSAMMLKWCYSGHDMTFGINFLLVNGRCLYNTCTEIILLSRKLSL